MDGRHLSLRKRLGLELYRRLHREAVERHELRTLFWECTLRCNLSCRHCGSDCRVDPGVPDMPLEDFLKVLDEEITPHVDPSEVLIIFSGGEVLVRPDLERAGAEVTRRGYAWGMVTNGMALTEARLRLAVGFVIQRGYPGIRAGCRTAGCRSPFRGRALRCGCPKRAAGGSARGVSSACTP